MGLVGLLYHVPAASHPEFPAVELLGDILESEPSGRLYKALVETKKATSVSVSPTAGHDPGAIEIMAEVNTKNLSVLEKVRDEMLSVVEGIAGSGVTQQEVDRARQRALKNRELAEVEPNRIAIELSEWAAQGTGDFISSTETGSKRSPRTRPRQSPRSTFTTSNRTVGFFVPTSTRRANADPGFHDLAKVLEGYTGRQVKSGSSETRRCRPLPSRPACNGPIRSAASSWRSCPRKTRGESVQLRLTLHYGNAENLKGLGEASGFLPAADDAGNQKPEPSADPGPARQERGPAGYRDEYANAPRVWQPGCWVRSTFTIETKRANLPAVLDILRQILREPSLPGSEFEVMKNEEIYRCANKAGRIPCVRALITYSD